MNQQGARGWARLGPWETSVPHPRPLVLSCQHKLYYYDASSNTSYSPPSSGPAVLKRLRSFSLRPEPLTQARYGLNPLAQVTLPTAPFAEAVRRAPVEIRS
jgi:hypothetical protein